MSTQELRSLDLEREIVRTLQDSLSNPLALISDNYNMQSNEAITIVGDRGKLAYLAWLLNRGSMEARVKAAGLIEKLATMERAATMKWVMTTSSNGVVSGLFKLLREGGDIPHAERASLSALAALYNGASEEAEIKLLVLEEKNGGLTMLIERLAGARRAKAERVLTVLKAISFDTEGLAALREHALTIPVLVRSLLVLSDLANELAISILWALTRAPGASLLASHDDVLLIEEASQLGLAQKLLVVAQMESNLQTKHKIRDLLKAMRALKCLSTSLYGSLIL